MALAKLYTNTILATTTLGLGLGFYTSNLLAYENYTKKSHLTTKEKIGEHFCYGTIVISGSLMGMICGSLYGFTSPASIPLSIYLYKNPDMLS